MAGWNGAAHFAVYYQWSGRTGFFLSVSLIPWLVLLVVFVLKMLKLHKRAPKVVNWSLTVNAFFISLFVTTSFPGLFYAFRKK